MKKYPKSNVINQSINLNNVYNKRDFSDLKSYPGEGGNPLDTALKAAERLGRIPSSIFILILFALAALFSFGRWPLAATLLVFCLTDWMLLMGLNKSGKSFGLPKPPALMLAVFRGLALMIPLPLEFEIALQMIGTGLLIYGFWIEPHHIQVTRQMLTTTKLNSGSCLRLLHLGDLHIERITQRERLLNKAIKNLSPDLILFSGDILNLSYLSDPVAWEEARKVIAEWQADLGVYFVKGSLGIDLPEILPEILKDMPVCLLDDESVSVDFHGEMIKIIGVSCTHRPFQDGPFLQTLIHDNHKHFSILLHHTPDLALDAAEAGIDLQLSGHTHGGQVRIPFYGALVSGLLYGKMFESGRHQIGDMTLYVTRGIGMEGGGAPRVRFLCLPEIILWEIRGKS
jgi:predicted MPP superfamily phosphohydrolase